MMFWTKVFSNLTMYLGGVATGRALFAYHPVNMAEAAAGLCVFFLGCVWRGLAES